MDTIKISGINVDTNVIDRIKYRKDNYVSGMLCRNVSYRHAGFMSWLAVRVMSLYNNKAEAKSFEVDEKSMASHEDALDLKAHTDAFISEMRESGIPEDVIIHMENALNRGIDIIEANHKAWKESLTTKEAEA
ncbi:hypothetical protein [Serratia sp. Se-RSBMAAmG]|uniref:hypothetical protein n=1 Tax=Serratia sp. Se-RSBMAAmG TaxID=3043305 RepID=UPI0024AFE8FD|nr:hypothetical protein [Serratia sp. Se-RSBMAAmG]MDI6977109.1 hypothetical protein [Serratia sp. Se-RSBMAAmG]